MKTKKKEIDHAKNQARAQFEHIKDMLERLDKNYREIGQESPVDQEIQEHPLEITYRSDWRPYGENLKPSEFNILLCTGGPAVRIIGEVDLSDCHIEYQDWGTQWTEYRLDMADTEILLRYCQYFVFE